MQIGCYSVLVTLATELVKITRGLLEMLMKSPHHQTQSILLLLLCNLYIMLILYISQGYINEYYIILFFNLLLSLI